jgi:hypothetical protein
VPDVDFFVDFMVEYLLEMVKAVTVAEAGITRDLAQCYPGFLNAPQ